MLNINKLDTTELRVSSLATPEVFKQSSINSLDGLRALSIIVVLLSHLSHTLNCPSFIQSIMFYTVGNFGVHIFFVLSGFLITGLLLKESVLKGSIKLRTFYYRRILRIFPVFYLYIIIIFIISFYYRLPIPYGTFFSAAFFIQNFTTGPGGPWLLTHSWSLAIEQQFYLIWPLILNISKNKPYYVWFISAIILLYPLLNTLLYYKPELSLILAGPLLRNLPSIMIGSFLAIVLFKQWHLALMSIIKSPIMGFGIVASWLTYLPAQIHQLGWFTVLFGYLCSSTFIAIFILHIIYIDKKTFFFKVFNNSIAKYIGKISYSLYIWQQLFLIPSNVYKEANLWWTFYPVNLIATLAIAILSYHFFEIPIRSFKFYTLTKTHVYCY